MSKHTPGPWAVWGDGCIYAESGAPVLTSWADSWGHYIVGYDADRRLAAAAPDLLAVCADLLEMSDAGVPCPPRLVVMARAAVAKARGE